VIFCGRSYGSDVVRHFGTLWKTESIFSRVFDVDTLFVFKFLFCAEAEVLEFGRLKREVGDDRLANQRPSPNVSISKRCGLAPESDGETGLFHSACHIPLYDSALMTLTLRR
jgi:hypothetical protein